MNYWTSFYWCLVSFKNIDLNFYHKKKKKNLSREKKNFDINVPIRNFDKGGDGFWKNKVGNVTQNWVLLNVEMPLQEIGGRLEEIFSTQSVDPSRSFVLYLNGSNTNNTLSPTHPIFFFLLSLYLSHPNTKRTTWIRRLSTTSTVPSSHWKIPRLAVCIYGCMYKLATMKLQGTKIV